MVSPAAVRSREVEMLKAELRSCRQGALREGARRALARAGREYAASVDAHSAGIRSAFDAVRDLSNRMSAMGPLLIRVKGACT